MPREEPAGCVALVTGGASGLGAATVRALHAASYSVIVFDRDERAGHDLAADLGPRVQAVSGSVLDSAAIEEAVEAASRLGLLRVAVACAGGATAAGRVVDRSGAPHDLESFTSTLDLNVVGTFNTLRVVAASMAQLPPDHSGERGCVVLVSSASAFEGQIGQVAYGTAKAALNAMTFIAARDLASHAIRVNAIAPGVMDTPGWEQAPPGLRERLAEGVPFPSRLGSPQEFAALVGHLVDNKYMNGHVVRLDGGLRFAPR